MKKSTVNDIWEIEGMAFLYQWYDKGKDMYYVGSHKGTPDDGYICSSEYMLEEYRKRPEDFEREILLTGTESCMRRKERFALQLVDAANNPKYYNRSNGGADFYVCMKGEENPIFGITRSPEVKQKISVSLSEYFSNEEVRKRHSERMKKTFEEGREPSCKKNFSMEEIEDILSVPFREARKKYDIGQNKYNKLRKEHPELATDFRKRPRTDEEKEELSKLLSGENNPNWGKTQPIEVRNRISKTLTGKCKGIKRSQEFRDNLSEKRKGEGNPMHGVEPKNKLKLGEEKEKEIEGLYFNKKRTQKEIANIFGISVSSVSRIIRKRKNG